MAKNLYKAILKGKAKNWQEKCIEEASKLIYQNQKEQMELEIDSFKDDLFVFEGSSQLEQSIGKKFRQGDARSRNIASIFANSLQLCNKTTENELKKWLKSELPNMLTKQVPLHNASTIFNKYEDFLSNIEVEPVVTDIKTIAQDYLDNMPNDLKKSKYWIGKDIHLPPLDCYKELAKTGRAEAELCHLKQHQGFGKGYK